MGITAESAGFLLFGFLSLCVAAYSEWASAREKRRQDKIISDLIDRISARDFAEYTAARQERERPGNERTESDFYETEEENVLAYQAVGGDWGGIPKDVRGQ